MEREFTIGDVILSVTYGPWMNQGDRWEIVAELVRKDQGLTWYKARLVSLGKTRKEAFHNLREKVNAMRLLVNTLTKA